MTSEDEAPLAALFAPRSVALVGAGADPDRAGGRLVAYMTGNGYAGRIHLVNPRRTEIDGRPCHPSIAALPEPVDLALIALNARLAPGAVAEAGRAGVRAAVVFASGFAELGEQGAALQRELAAAAEGTGVRVLGPNTAGVRATAIGLFGEQGTNLATVGYRPGSVAMISQSGALGGYFGSTYLTRLGVGTRYFVDTGNEIDVDAADCLEHVSRDPQVSCVALVLEGCKDGRKLTRAVRDAVRRGLPVLFMKVGRSTAGVAAAQSHTAAMASSAELLETELAAAGAVVTRDEVQLADAMLLHATGSAPAGRRLGIVTPSGGFGVLALDIAAESGLTLPPLPLPTSPRLAGSVGLGGMGNPLEVAVLAAPGTDLLAETLRHVGEQPDVDAVVLWHPHRMLLEKEQDAHLEVLARRRVQTGKPHFHCGIVPPEFGERLQAAGVLSFSAPSRLMKAIAAAAGPPAPVAAASSTQPAQTPEGLSAEEARALLDRAGIEVLRTEVVATAEEAMRLHERWGRLVFLKLESTAATHKTEHGLVRGPLGGPAVARAFAELAASPVRAADPDARIVVQPFETGVELALGTSYDAAFGPAVMVGHGGVNVEVLRDIAFAAAPVDAERAREMLRGLRIHPALAGARGTPADVDAVVAALVGLSELAAGPAGMGVSIDVNPLVVRPAGRGAVAVDVRVVPER